MNKQYPNQWAESANSYYFQVKLPGFQIDDIDIKVDQGTLKIYAEKGKASFNDDDEVDNKNTLSPNEKFEYQQDLPVDKIALEKVHAFMQGQLLAVKCPKLKKSDLPTIKVEIMKPKL